MRLVAAASALVAAAALVVPAAQAKVTGTPPGFVVHYPSGDAPDPASLQAVMSNPAVSAIVFERGTQLFSTTLFVFKRNDLTLCGVTGDPKDVVLQSTAAHVFQVEQATGVTFRGLTVATTATGGTGIFVNAVPDSTMEGFADDVSVERCVFSGYVGVQASVRAKNLSIADSAFQVGGFSPGSASGGVGVLWEDGPGLFVTRSRFTTQSGVSAVAGLFVRGAQTPTSEGDRASHLLITRNSVNGDFAAGFDLADLNGAAIRQNTIEFPNSVVPGVRGRVGIVVRRAAATQFTEDYSLTRNVFRRAHYGVWLLGVGAGGVVRNDFHGCGSPQPDVVGGSGFGDRGGAMRINLAGRCQTNVSSNDFRGLRSPLSDPAVVMFPAVTPCPGGSNRVDQGRAVFGGANP
jgi:hypothetical protein